MTKIKALVLVVLASVLSVLVACGGGGAVSAPTPAPTPAPVGKLDVSAVSSIGFVPAGGGYTQLGMTGTIREIGGANLTLTKATVTIAGVPAVKTISVRIAANGTLVCEGGAATACALGEPYYTGITTWQGKVGGYVTLTLEGTDDFGHAVLATAGAVPAFLKH